jgi:hypothetical protein
VTVKYAAGDDSPSSSAGMATMLADTSTSAEAKTSRSINAAISALICMSAESALVFVAAGNRLPAGETVDPPAWITIEVTVVDTLPLGAAEPGFINPIRPTDTEQDAFIDASADINIGAEAPFATAPFARVEFMLLLPHRLH